MRKFVVHLANQQHELMTNSLLIDHVNYLRELNEKGLLSFCGPCKDGTAFMIIYG
jgi:uncharacterized protein